MGLGVLSLAFVALAGSLGCEVPEPELDDPYQEDLCRVAEGTTHLAGKWTIVGSGNRRTCIEDGFEGAFRLGTSQALSVQQDGSVLPDGSQELALSNPISFSNGSFDLEGTVRGVCVDFTTTEEGPQGRVVYHFSGTVSDSGVIRGSFAGDGPSQCESDGTFSVEIR